MARDLVWIQMRAGQHDAAMELLRRIVSSPGGETYHGLRLNPRYDGLRGHPDFPSLLDQARTRSAPDSGEG